MPYPPNYGGVIDVFYKIKELKKLGVKIHLHTFEYGRGKHEKLEKYCYKVYYYKRNSYFLSTFSKIPFVVKSRANQQLINRLQKDNFPILFEGLHTTFPIYSKAINTSRVFVRAHNIEHNFYRGLFESESSIFKKKFFKYEAEKLKEYESLLSKVQGIFPISPFEQSYFSNKYGNKSTYIPAFYEATINHEFKPSEKIILYHGNLTVPENINAVQFLIEVYKNSNHKLIIASRKLDRNSKALIKNIENINFIEIPTQESLQKLFEVAHINVLPTFQKTGIKLKLLNTLSKGKFVITNNQMIEDTGLEDLVEIANTKKEFLEKTELLFSKNFNQEIINKRIEILSPFNPKMSAEKLVKNIFN